MAKKPTGIKKQEKKGIELYGLLGSFSTPKSNYTVKYFSTFASKKEKDVGPSQLLQELKPFRERVKANELNDLSSLLQRDLNDSRVASELVPYLLGDTREIAFFPAILGVLMPKKFLQSQDGVYPFPKVEESSDGDIQKEYWTQKDLFWKITEYGGTPLGMMEIFPDSTNVIVIDGQHRANAFRVMTGDFFEENGTELYTPFYDTVRKSVEASKDFDADLPVLLIWFESKSDAKEIRIDPKLISRKLFVDVNNTAKSVSTSRTILLNDYDPASVLTRTLYSQLAANSGFSKNNFSMLHSGFDVDSDLANSSPHVFTITTPQILHFAIDWTILGSRRYTENLHLYKVARMRGVPDTSHAARLLPLFRDEIKINEHDDEDKFYDYNSFLQKNEEEKRLIRAESENKFANPIIKLFSDFIFLDAHFKACQDLFDHTEEWDGQKEKVLEEVFCGGEGLYYAYQNVPKTDNSPAVKKNQKYISEIESEFKSKRFQVYITTKGNKPVSEKLYNEAFDSFRTKAFQLGLIITFFETVEDAGNEAQVDDFIKKLNSISAFNWVNIFRELAPPILGGLDPKKWPGYHKIILRVLGTDQSGKPFFPKKHMGDSPDVVLFRNLLEEKIKGWCQSHGLTRKDLKRDQIEKGITNQWIEELPKNVDQILESCGLELLVGIDFGKIGRSYIKNEIGGPPKNAD